MIFPEPIFGIAADLRRRIPEQMAALEPALEGFTVLACTGSHALLSLAVMAYPRIDLWADSIEALLGLPIPEQGPVLLACNDDLPDGSILELIMQLRRARAGRPLLVMAVLDANTDPLRLKGLAAEGVQGLCCSQAVGNGQLLSALSAVLHGGSFVDAGFAIQLREPNHSGSRFGSPSCLSRRERAVLERTSKGYNSDEIAAQMALRPDTIRRYQSEAYQKIGVRDRTQAVLWCMAHGLVTQRELQQVFR